MFPAGLLGAFSERMPAAVLPKPEATSHVQGTVMLLPSGRDKGRSRLSQSALPLAPGEPAGQTSDAFARSQLRVFCSSAWWCDRVCVSVGEDVEAGLAGT